MNTVYSLLSRTEISETIFRYARGFDRMDLDMALSCFHADSVHDHGNFHGFSHDFCKYAMALVAELDHTQHHISNVSVDLVGDIAHTEAYFLAYHRVGPKGWSSFSQARPGEDVLIGGRYRDRFERRSGAWRIAHRRGIYEWSKIGPAADNGIDQQCNHYRGRRDQTDWFYNRYQSANGQEEIRQSASPPEIKEIP